MSIYTGVEGVVRTVSKVPITVGGVVKEAKKGVCGVDGVVRQFYAGNVIYENGSEGYSLVAASSRTDGFGCYAEKKEDRMVMRQVVQVCHMGMVVCIRKRQLTSRITPKYR